MHELIEIPPRLSGEMKNQIQQIWQYLFALSETLNRNLQSVGGNNLTDQEQQTMHGILGTSGDQESLKDMVIKLAAYVQGTEKNIKDNSLAEDVTSGKFGRYVQQTEISVETDPGGDGANRTIKSVIQLLKAHDINIRNYVMAGEVRTGVYGVAIGKNIRTFTEDGTETYQPDNRVMEIAEDGIKIYENGDELLKITVSEVDYQTIVSIEPGDGADQVNITGNVFGDLTGNVEGDVIGELTGKVLNSETTETDYDNIMDAGKYWIDVSSMSNGPSDLVSGTCLLEVTEGTIIRQQLSAEDVFYTRHKTSGTWGSWYKFTGTAV